jgi:hypothetical protein
MGKEIGAMIGLILGLPTAVALAVLAFNSVLVSTGRMNVTDYSQQWGQAVVDLATPWWVPLLEWGVPGAIVFIAVIVIFGKKAL